MAIRTDESAVLGLSRLLPAVFVVLLVGCAVSSAASVNPLEVHAVQTALLDEDWVKLVEVLGPDSLLDSYPLARLIKGHACLALNRNNESLCLFLSATSHDVLTDWEAYTERLREKHPDSPVALYLCADAYSRLGKSDSALAAIDLALAKDPEAGLLYNARGVINAAIGDWDSARKAIERAVHVAPELADAHTNRGILRLKIEDAAEAALEYFNQALVFSPHSAVALNGRGCAYYGLCKWDSAQQDFLSAVAASGCYPVAMRNHRLLQNLQNELADVFGDTLDADSAKMPLTQRISSALATAIHNTKAFMWNNVVKPTYQAWTPTSITAGMQAGISASGPQATLGVQAHYNTQANGQFMTNYSNAASNYHQQMATQAWSQAIQPGGVLLDYKRVIVEEGNWPYSWVGLLYDVEPQNQSR